ASVTLVVHAHAPQAGPTKGPPKVLEPDDRARLRDLEKKIDKLYEALDALRRELRPQKSSRSNERMPSDDVPVLHQRDVRIPFQLGPNAPNIVRLLLYYSTDEGKTWTQAAEAGPDDGSFRFHAPADGLYWLAVATVDASGRRQPDYLPSSSPSVKVRI